MLPDRVSNPGPLTYESGALPIALRGPATIKYGSYCIGATAQMKFASEARPSQYIGPFGNTEPTCMPLSGHFMDIEVCIRS